MIGGVETETRQVPAGAPQGSPLLLILFLFYNAELLELYLNNKLQTTSIGFVDDIYILVYRKSTEINCRHIKQVYYKYLE
jgi:hypothetical protein